MPIYRKITTIFVILTLLNIVAFKAQAATTADLFQPLHFLVGSWVGAGKSDSGAIKGTMQFDVELQGHVMVRRDRSTFGTTAPKTAAYEQMMVISPDPQSPNAFDASYWDSAGHVIQYVGTVQKLSVGEEVQFLSTAPPNAPHFRLTYTSPNPDTLHTVFEIQTPGSADWHTIADGICTRAKLPMK